MNESILIVGAGPTGLAMAIGLEKQGIPFRIVDKNPGPARASRAMTVQGGGGALSERKSGPRDEPEVGSRR